MVHDLLIDESAYWLLVNSFAFRPSHAAVARSLAAAGLEARPELVAALAEAAATPCIVTGGLDRDAIIRALGEVGGVWPDGILPDVVRQHVDHLRRQDGKAAA